MLFTSLPFFAFLIIVVAVYSLLRHRAQNLWLLAASYAFYGYWSWRFSLLVLFSTAVNFACAALIHRVTSLGRKRFWLWTALGINLGILGFFKYYNFFAGNAEEFLSMFGLEMSWTVKHLILPVGISFYTFQALSYTIDVYRKRLEPVRSFPDFALFVSFFPQLVAGPIERATHLLPQIANPRQMTAAKVRSGCWLILLGIYKKVFVADQLGRHVGDLMGPSESYVGGDVILGCALFSLQIYADFSGYTDVARGTGRLLGVELIQNFRAPYFARNIQEFWNRWHISLTTWIKEYMFYPMALSRRWNRILSPGAMSLVVMVVIGFWHGASWNYLLWGVYHGLVIHCYMKLRPWLFRNFQFHGEFTSRAWFVLCVIFTFGLIAAGEVLFLGDSLVQSWWMLRDVVMNPGMGPGSWSILSSAALICAVPFVLDLDAYHNRETGPPLATWHRASVFAVQGIILVSLAQVLLVQRSVEVEPYVYFQF